MNIQELRHITNLTTQAAAALLPLSHDGEGRDSHGGKLTDPAKTLDGALVCLVEVGALAAQMRAKAGHPQGESERYLDTVGDGSFLGHPEHG